MINWQEVKYFHPEIDKMLACPCCGILNINTKAIWMLDDARHIAGIPFHITSACRCIDYNSQQIGGVDSSAHTASKRKECFAFDISATESRQRYLILISLDAAGFNRIGIGKDFIHCDNDFSKTKRVVWVY